MKKEVKLRKIIRDFNINYLFFIDDMSHYDYENNKKFYIKNFISAKLNLFLMWFGFFKNQNHSERIYNAYDGVKQKNFYSKYLIKVRVNLILRWFGFKKSKHSLNWLYNISNDKFFKYGYITKSHKLNSLVDVLRSEVDGLSRKNIENFNNETESKIKEIQNGSISDKQVKYFNDSKEKVYKIFDEPSYDPNNYSPIKKSILR